jgi:hypothetical protein
MYRRDLALYRNALLVVLTSLGIPHLYYGGEAALGWDWLGHHNPDDPPSDTDFREPFWPHGYRRKGLSGDGYIFTAIQRVIRARRATRLWDAGREVFLPFYLSAFTGVVAYRRGDSAVVVVANGNEDLPQTLPLLGEVHTRGCQCVDRMCHQLYGEKQGGLGSTR